MKKNNSVEFSIFIKKRIFCIHLYSISNCINNFKCNYWSSISHILEAYFQKHFMCLFMKFFVSFSILFSFFLINISPWKTFNIFIWIFMLFMQFYVFLWIQYCIQYEVSSGQKQTTMPLSSSNKTWNKLWMENQSFLNIFAEISIWYK